MTLTAPVSLTVTGFNDPFNPSRAHVQRPQETYVDRTSNNTVDVVSASPRTRFDLLNSLRAQLVSRAGTMPDSLLDARTRVNNLAALLVMDDGPTPQVVCGEDYVEVQWLVNGNSVTMTSYDDGENNVAAYTSNGQSIADEDFVGEPGNASLDAIKALLTHMAHELSTRVSY